jgi:hypothetical protein
MAGGLTRTPSDHLGSRFRLAECVGTRIRRVVQHAMDRAVHGDRQRRALPKVS